MDTTQELWDHQKIGIQKGLRHNNFAFFFDAGTGKSRVIVEILRQRFAQNQRVLRTLIFAPQITCGNWVNEFKKFSKIDTNREVFNLAPLTGAKRVSLMGEAANHIVIINYEALRNAKVFQALYDWNPEALICDESHRVKSYKSKAAKLVEKLADRSQFKYLLTGTPFTNSIEDYYQQFRILDGGETFGKNFWAFRAQWMEDANAQWAGQQKYFPKWVPKRGFEEAFRARIKKKSMVVKKEECLDLPPMVSTKLEVELSPEQKRLYNEMKNDYLTFVSDQLKDGKPQAAVAQLAITKALRLQQIVTGFVTTDQGDDHIVKKNPRINALKDLLVDKTVRNKVIVWATFKQNYKDIAKVCKELNLKYVELHGDAPKNKRDEYIDAFNNDPEVRVLIGNQGAGGIGINLVAANHMIYYSKDFSLEKDIQSEARNYRGGSEVHDKITRIDLVAKDTIDEHINRAIRDKVKLSESILNWKL